MAILGSFLKYFDDLQWWLFYTDTFVPGLYFCFNAFSGLLNHPLVETWTLVTTLFVWTFKISILSETEWTNHHCMCKTYSQILNIIPWCLISAFFGDDRSVHPPLPEQPCQKSWVHPPHHPPQRTASSTPHQTCLGGPGAAKRSAPATPASRRPPRNPHEQLMVRTFGGKFHCLY